MKKLINLLMCRWLGCDLTIVSATEYKIKWICRRCGYTTYSWRHTH